MSYDPGLDEWIVHSLRKNMVDVVIIEQTSWFSTDARLNDFPLLKSYIGENFDRTGQVGMFKIYEKK